MPIFMDRHNLKGVTAAELADAHRKDLEIQEQYRVKFRTYWYDEHSCTAFCLVDAPDKEAAQAVHREAHGFVAEEIMEVSLTAVEAFLGRITDPAAAPGSQPAIDAGHRTVMFTDIVGSTEMTARLGDQMAAELVRAHDSIVRGSLTRFGGRQVKHTGDGIMASFQATIAAVDCAKQIQQSFEHHNSQSREPIHVRIGLDSGDPVEDSNDLFGRTVQLAARLCAAALRDQILASETVKRESGGAAFLDRGARSLKGFSEPVVAYECIWRTG